MFQKKAHKTEDSKKDEDKTPFNPPVLADEHCVVEGCLEGKAPGQTHVCQKHIRTN